MLKYRTRSGISFQECTSFVLCQFGYDPPTHSKVPVSHSPGRWERKLEFHKCLSSRSPPFILFDDADQGGTSHNGKAVTIIPLHPFPIPHVGSNLKLITHQKKKKSTESYG